MKILYLHQYFATPDSNGGTRSYEMAKRLISRGHKVELVTSSAFLPKEHNLSNGWNKLEIDGISLHVYQQSYSNKVSFTKRIYKFFEFLVAATLYVRKIKADVVFATSTPLTIAIPGVFYSKSKRVPMIFEVRDLWPEVPIALGIIKNPLVKYLAKRLELFAYRNARKIVALSPEMEKGVINSNVSPDLVSCIPNSCDLDLFEVPKEVGEEYKKKHFPFVGNRKLVVYTGTFGMVNNVSYLVEVAKQNKLRQDNICYIAIGDGMEKQKVIMQAKEQEVYEDNLYILDPVKKKEVPSILSASDLSLSMVGPVEEMWKNGANKLFDSFAASRPIAISHEGWQKELLEKHRCGFSFCHLNPSKAAQQIATKLSDEQWLEDAKQNASYLARNVYSRELMAEKLETVITSTLK